MEMAARVLYYIFILSQFESVLGGRCAMSMPKNEAREFHRVSLGVQYLLDPSVQLSNCPSHGVQCQHRPLCTIQLLLFGRQKRQRERHCSLGSGATSQFHMQRRENN